MQEIKFIADVMLGKLSRLLRILGFDTLYYRNLSDETLLSIAREHNRQILTRKTSLKNRKDSINQLCFIKDNYPLNQLKEVIDFYHLKIDPCHIFSLCLSCNQKLEEVNLEQAKDRVPEYIAATQTEFSLCPLCKKIYWRGSHYENTWERLKYLL
jgi:uncharacterized protein with PIN domain